MAVGLFVALGLGALLVLALKVSNISRLTEQEGYPVYARFDNIGGLKPRSPVTMAGVRIGRVHDIEFDEQNFQAVVELRIDPRFRQIPDDTSAAILTAGLLGEQYIGLEAGGSLEVLEPGSELLLTQSALVLEQIIGQFLFSKASEGPAQ